MQTTDLLIFWSFTNTNPNDSNHEKKIKSKPKAIVIRAKDAEGRNIPKFKEQYLYISFISERGCQLEVTSVLKQAQASAHQISVPTFGEQDQEDTNLELIEKDDPYYIEYRKLQRQRERRQKEVIQGNIQNTSNKKEPSRAFNHPDLAMYHRDQAKLRNEQL